MSAAGRESSALSVHSAVLEPLPSDAFAGRRCLVTGGLGFIGSNLALALSAGGAEVTVVDALVPTHGGDRGNLDDAAGPIDVIDAQVDDAGRVRDAAARSDMIFNLAGQVSHVESMARP